MNPDTKHPEDEWPESTRQVDLSSGPQMSIGEILEIFLRHNRNRRSAVELIARTLATLGITGEEVAHVQNNPGMCWDSVTTDAKNRGPWQDKLKEFPKDPFTYGRGYYKTDGPTGRRYKDTT